ncbi:hypothetical protein HanXRQr2_Chr10g0418211 [Helianthus annuus]|uniref:Uncharacterized protein n=1 Tax=Helianthus annuus TaxID=4232 RepID=A0A9K3HU53_HELAN|nr:hypothetical protein HanXRQr2_Chr10g0418211 [Helianthus annuus]KAJ0882007.1 hypothetical protein HanPSC8_Chr10g0404571 [Helianthus annuus]
MYYLFMLSKISTLIRKQLTKSKPYTTRLTLLDSIRHIYTLEEGISV